MKLCKSQRNIFIFFNSPFFCSICSVKIIYISNNNVNLIYKIWITDIKFPLKFPLATWLMIVNNLGDCGSVNWHLSSAFVPSVLLFCTFWVSGLIGWLYRKDRAKENIWSFHPPLIRWTFRRGEAFRRAFRGQRKHSLRPELILCVLFSESSEVRPFVLGGDVDLN